MSFNHRDAIRCFQTNPGPYYTYFAKPSPSSIPVPTSIGAGQAREEDPWSSMPDSIVEARNLIRFLVQDHWSDTFQVEELTVLAWLNVGNRKV